MLSDLLLEKINSQINIEFYSAYTYLAMSAYAESVDLSGFANFFKIQAEEELFHAMKLYNYVFQKNGFVNLAVLLGMLVVVTIVSIELGKFLYNTYGV